MRTTVPLAIAAGLALGVAGLRSAAGDRPEPASAAVEARFRAEVRPLLEFYCLGCHGKDKPKGDLDLSGFTTAESVARDLPRWELVLEQLEAGSMPPAKAARRPPAEARGAALAWIKAIRKAEAARHAGDPGAVPRGGSATPSTTTRSAT